MVESERSVKTNASDVSDERAARIAEAYLRLLASHPGHPWYSEQDFESAVSNGGMMCRALCAMARIACQARGGRNCDADYQNCVEGCDQ